MMNKDVFQIELTADIVAAYISNNAVPISELPKLIGDVYTALSSVAAEVVTEEPERQKPAVPIKKSVTPDHIISLEDGKKFRSLKRHLMTHYGMTPDDYRAKWNLPRDYPMVAPNYAAARSQLAKEFGLGRKPGEKPKRRSGRKAG